MYFKSIIVMFIIKVVGSKDSLKKVLTRFIQ